MRRSATRWLAVARIARRDARRHKGRTTLIVAMLMLPAFAASLFATAWATSNQSQSTYTAASLGSEAQASLFWSADCAILQTASGDNSKCATGEPGEGPAKGADAIVAAGIAADRIVPAETQGVSVTKATRAVNDLGVTQLETAAVPGLLRIIDGHAPSKAGDIVIVPSTATVIGARPGDEVVLKNMGGATSKATISGIAASVGAAAFAYPGTLPPPGETESAGWSGGWGGPAYYITGDQPVGWEMVKKLNSQGFVVTSRDVLAHPPADAPTEQDMYPTPTDYTSLALVAGMVAIGVIEVLLIIGPAFAVGARRSRRTLALLSASGGEGKDLRRVLIATGLGLGAIAGLVGFALGAGLAIALLKAFQSKDELVNAIAVPAWAPLFAIPVTALLGTIAAMIPGRSIARLDPVVALRGGPDAAMSGRSRAWPGLTVTGLGMAAAIGGALIANPQLAMAGAVILLIGVIMLSGLIVRWSTRLAPRAGLATRIALRDAERHRSRTAPALAAVIACVAGGTIAMGYTASEAAMIKADNRPVLGAGLIAVSSDAYGSAPDEGTMSQVIPRIEAIDPGAKALTVRLADPSNSGKLPSLACPGSTNDENRFSCTEGVGGMVVWTVGEMGSSYEGLIDDGSATGANGLPGAAEAAAALRSGKVLVGDARLLDAQGNATLDIAVMPTEANPEPAKTRVTLPAAVANWGSYPWQLVLPPTVADDLGIKAAFAGYLVVPSSELTAEQIGKINALGSDATLGASVRVEQEPYSGVSLQLIVAALALIVGAAAVWIAVGLAAADSRTDMATLSAVGAAPRVRRRLAGAQAAVIAVTGSVIGVVLGGILLWVVDTVSRAHSIELGSGAIWPYVVPWGPQAVLTLGVPLLAVLAAMAFTRSKVPLLGRRAN